MILIPINDNLMVQLREIDTHKKDELIALQVPEEGLDKYLDDFRRICYAGWYSNNSYNLLFTRKSKWDSIISSYVDNVINYCYVDKRRSDAQDICDYCVKNNINCVIVGK